MISPRVRRVMIKAIIIICGIESPIVWKNLRIFFFESPRKVQWTWARIEWMVLMLFARWIRCWHSQWGSLANIYVYLKPVEQPCAIAQYPHQAFCKVDSTSTHFARQIRENTPTHTLTFETRRAVWNMKTVIQYLFLKTTGQTKKDLLTMVFKTTYGKLDLYAPLRKKHRSKITTMPEQPSKNVFLWFLRMVFKIIRTTIWKLDRYALVLFRKAFCREKASNQK